MMSPSSQQSPVAPRNSRARTIAKIFARWWTFIVFIIFVLLGNIVSVLLSKPIKDWPASALAQIGTIVQVGANYPIPAIIFGVVVLVFSVIGWRASIALGEPASDLPFPVSPSRPQKTRVRNDAQRRANMAAARNIFVGIATVAAIISCVAGIVIAIIHNNATQWSVMNSQNASSYENTINSMVAIDPSDVWAVGSTNNRAGTSQALIEQWNGSSWAIVPSPNVVGSSNSLTSITKVSASDLLAVGNFVNNAGITQTLIEQWNGAIWSVVTSPNAGSSTNILKSVVAVDATHAWAVGYYVDQSTIRQTLIEQWDGTTWSIAPSSNANIGTRNNVLNAVDAIDATHAWAVGGYDEFGGSTTLGWYELVHRIRRLY